MAEELETTVTWAEGKVALDLHIGSPVRVVVTGMFGTLHSEGILQPSDEPGPSDDHAFYMLESSEYDPAFTLTRNMQAVCTVTGSALMIEYEQAMIRIVWADLSEDWRQRSALPWRSRGCRGSARAFALGRRRYGSSGGRPLMGTECDPRYSGRPARPR